MGNVFGDPKTMKQVIREQKRGLDRSIRSLERERTSLERDEKKNSSLTSKKAAKSNQLKSCKIMAKDLVRIRKHQEKFINLTAQLRAIGLQMTSMASTQALVESMRKVTRSMTQLNRTMNLPALQKIMVEFAKQSEQMDMKQEMVGDALEDAMDNEEDEVESEAVVNQVLDEIGIDLKDSLVDAPSKQVGTEKPIAVKTPAKKVQAVAQGGGAAAPAAAAAGHAAAPAPAAAPAAAPASPAASGAGADDDAALEARLNNLKKDG